MVLCKELDAELGRVSFVTNYDSRKGRELEENARAALVFHWDHVHRQIRIEGIVVKAPAAESDAYFETRNWQRRIGAWASAQSQPLRSREQLNAAVRAAADRFGAPHPTPENINEPQSARIPRPPFWGGYYVWADAVELWIEGAVAHPRARPLDPFANYRRRRLSRRAVGGDAAAALSSGRHQRVAQTQDRDPAVHPRQSRPIRTCMTA